MHTIKYVSCKFKFKTFKILWSRRFPGQIQALIIFIEFQGLSRNTQCTKVFTGNSRTAISQLRYRIEVKTSDLLSYNFVQICMMNVDRSTTYMDHIYHIPYIHIWNNLKWPRISHQFYMGCVNKDSFPDRLDPPIRRNNNTFLSGRMTCNHSINTKTKWHLSVWKWPDISASPDIFYSDILQIGQKHRDLVVGNHSCYFQCNSLNLTDRCIPGNKNELKVKKKSKLFILNW